MADGIIGGLLGDEDDSGKNERGDGWVIQIEQKKSD